MNQQCSRKYGQADTTYRALGREPGIRKLVHDFYHHMATDPDCKRIWSWHHELPAIMEDKLALFLCAWTGGPKNYAGKYGGLRIPAFHAQLDVTATERDLWLRCMHKALLNSAYPQQLVDYMLAQLFVPAERIREVCQGGQ